MLRRSFKGRYTLLRDRLVFVQVSSQEFPRKHTPAKTEGTPLCIHMALKIFMPWTCKQLFLESEQNTGNYEQAITVCSPQHPWENTKFLAVGMQCLPSATPSHAIALAGVLSAPSTGTSGGEGRAPLSHNGSHACKERRDSFQWSPQTKRHKCKSRKQ